MLLVVVDGDGVDSFTQLDVLAGRVHIHIPIMIIADKQSAIHEKPRAVVRGRTELVVTGRDCDVTDCNKCKIVDRCAWKRLCKIIVEGQILDNDIVGNILAGQIPTEIGEIPPRRGHVHRHIPSWPANGGEPF